MIRYITFRLMFAIPVLFLVSVGTFLLVYLVPGNPVDHIIGPNSTHAQYLQIQRQLGLDRPVLVRYWEWLSKVLQGNLGINLVPPVESVRTRIIQALPVNIELTIIALVLGLVVSIPLAVFSAYKENSVFDRLIGVGTIAAISIPTFLLALVLVLLVAIDWHLFPIGQWVRPSGGWLTNLRYALLPSIVLAIDEAAIFTRLLRSELLETLNEDYILAARAKGMSSLHILFREALRPSSFSLVTLSGLSIGRLIGGSIIAEQVFSLPGIGSIIVNAAQQSDYPLVQGGVLVVAVVYVTSSLIVDVVHGVIDPRVRRRHG
jgi:peptide/nickel transport system permease protein